MFKKTALFVALVASLAAPAYAGPTYQCQPQDAGLAPLMIFIQNAQTIEFATVLDGRLVPKTTVSYKASLNAPEGFTGYFAVGGCKTTGPGMHCFAISYETLFVSQSMLAEEAQGEVILNSESYSCSISQ